MLRLDTVYMAPDLILDILVWTSQICSVCLSKDASVLVYAFYLWQLPFMFQQIEIENCID